MTAFEITLVCLILYIIDWIYILKNWDNKKLPHGFEEWLLAFVISLLIACILVVIGFILIIIIKGLFNIDWHAYFTQKIF